MKFLQQSTVRHQQSIFINFIDDWIDLLAAQFNSWNEVELCCLMNGWVMAAAGGNAPPKEDKQQQQLN